VLKTTVGQLLINEALPEDLRDYSREYDKKTVNSVLEQVARQYPEKYREISFQLGNLGRRFAHEQGGFSFGAEHLLKSKAAQAIQDEVKSKVQTILDNDKLTPAQRREQIVLTTGRESERLQKAVMQEALDAGNPLALQIISGTRGKPMNLASLLGSDMLYADHRDRPIPIPVLRSYAQGLSQAEYWAGTYGARKGVLATKFCLAKGTEVLMSDFTHKPIEQVEPGDEVFTLGKNDNLEPTRVVRRYDNGVRSCSSFYFRGYHFHEITATGDHKILIETTSCEYEMRPLGQLTLDTDITIEPVLTGYERYIERRAKYVGYIPRGELPTYDLEVEHPSHRFVLANMLVVSNSTQNAGFFSKQLNAAAHRLVVTGEDDDEFDTESPRGFPVDADDPDSEGALLASDTGPYKRNTVLTPKIIKHLKRLGKNQFLVRSPTVGGSPDGGLFARDVGVRERGSLPGRGEIVGLSASQALSEPISQGQLCLAAGTLVRMADGHVKPIEAIVPEDVVMGAAVDGTTFPVRVVRIYDNGEKDCVRTEFWCAKEKQFVTLLSTEAHKVLGAAYWRSGAFNEGVLPVGEICDVFYARLPLAHARRMSQEPIGRLATYDIEVDHPDHLFVLANGLIVSNSAKHSGGVAGQEKAVSGFDLLNQLVQVPKKMRGGAAHATADGQVDSIEPAPAGGFNVMVSGAKHYVPSGLDLKIQVGDKVEAGDLLSDGIPNPAVIVEHKGVGEGRRYFVNEFRKAMQESGMSANRRNIELLARGLINHVQLTDEYEDYVPDDVVPYSSIERSWQPRNGAASAPPQAAVGKYLERPVLHYTIGTKIQPSMLKQFEQFGVQKVTVHDDPPPFKPHMVRGMYQMQNDPDWMTQMYGSGLKKSLLTSTARGATSDPGGTSFVPSLAIGKDFGNVPGRAIQAPKPSYDLPQVPLPDSNLLSYKEATEATGVDTTKGMPSSNVLPTRLPPAAPASPMPSGPRAPSYSSAPYGGTMAGAEQLRQMGAGTSLGAPSTHRWGSPVASQGPTPSVMPQAPKSAPQPPAQTQPVDPTLKSMGPYGLTSSIGATRTLLATPIAAAQSYATAIPAVSSTLQRATNLAGQARTAAPWLAKAAPVVRGGAMMSGLTKGTPALAGVVDAVGTFNDIYDKGHFAAGDEQIAHLRHLLKGDYGLATPLHAVNTVLQPVRNANAAGVALTHTFNELRDGGAEAVGDVVKNTWQNLTGSNEQIKDPTVSSTMLNSVSLPARIDKSLLSLRQQLAGEADIDRQSQLRDRIGRIETLRKSYAANTGMLGTGQFGTMLTGNLQGMKQTLNSVEQQLQSPNLDPVRRQDLLNHRQRLQNDIGTYQGWLQ